MQNTCKCYYKTTALSDERERVARHMDLLREEHEHTIFMMRMCTSHSRLADAASFLRRVHALEIIDDGIRAEFKRMRNVLTTCDKQIEQVESKCKHQHHFVRGFESRPIRQSAKSISDPLSSDVPATATVATTEDETLLEAISAGENVRAMLIAAGVYSSDEE